MVNYGIDQSIVKEYISILEELREIESELHNQQPAINLDSGNPLVTRHHTLMDRLPSILSVLELTAVYGEVCSQSTEELKKRINPVHNPEKLIEMLKGYEPNEEDSKGTTPNENEELYTFSTILDLYQHLQSTYEKELQQSTYEKELQSKTSDPDKLRAMFQRELDRAGCSQDVQLTLESILAGVLSRMS